MSAQTKRKTGFIKSLRYILLKELLKIKVKLIIAIKRVLVLIMLT